MLRVLGREFDSRHLQKEMIFWGGNMNVEKLKEKIDSANVVEELIDLSKKVFDKSSDEVKDVIETFITQSYIMGKRNATKSFDA
jgi:hypothetical protein